MPFVEKNEAKPPMAEGSDEIPSLDNSENAPPIIKKNSENEKTEDNINSTTEENETSSEMTKIKFVHPTPSFVWKDMKVYGPFEKNDETEIFPEVAELLVRKGRAEKV